MSRMSPLAIVVVVLTLVGAACGGTTATTTTVGATTTEAATAAATTTVAVTTTEAITTTTVAVTSTRAVVQSTTIPYEPTDPSVLVNGGWLAYECRGDGSPTVLVELGLGDFNPYGFSERDPDWLVWGGTLDLIAETNKVCIYGRRGVIGSEPVPKNPPRTTQDQVDELDGLIDALELETPLILVAHSVGGYNIRLFAGQHPESVAGLVFVDATEPGIAEFDEIPIPFPPEWLDLATSTAQVAAVTDLGDLPVYVLTATISTDENGLSGDSVDDWWFELQDNLLALSTNSVQTKLETNHRIIWWAEAEAVVDAIAWVTAQAG